MRRWVLPAGKGDWRMPSEEYCRELAEKIDDRINDWLDANKSLQDSMDDQMSNAEDRGKAGAKLGPDVFDRSSNDFVGDAWDYFFGEQEAQRDEGSVNRELQRMDELNDRIEKADKEWCEECGDPSEPEDDGSAFHSLTFMDSEAETITSFGSKSWR